MPPLQVPLVRLGRNVLAELDNNGYKNKAIIVALIAKQEQ